MKDNHHFLTGLLLGGIAAGATALLMAPKSGKELCQNISDTYNSIAEKTGGLSDEIKHKSWHILHPNERCVECEGSSPAHFMKGATLGAIIGITSALFLAPKSGAKLRGDIEKSYNDIMDQGEEWKDATSNFIHNLQKTFGKTTKNSSPIHHVLDLVNTGYQMWQNIKGK